ncbi:MAG: MFS transporter [Chloroflexi bacterium]|nr:MFS transporter [Chloroflexota bacterium]
MVRMVSAFSLGRGATGAAAERRRNLIAISVVSFLASVGFMVVMPFLPVLLREVTGGDAASAGLWLGLAISVAPLMTALTAPIWTAIGDRFGRKAMLERSVVCIGIGIGLMAVASTAWHVVALRAVVGGLGGVSVAALAAITATTPRRELGPAVGTLQAAQTAGAMFGPLMGGVLGSMLGMREAFVLAALIFVLALGLIHVLFTDMPALVEPPVRPTTREQSRSAGALGVGIAVALTAAFLLQFIEGSFLILFPIELERLGVADEHFAMVFGVGLSLVYLAATISAAVAGRLTGRWSAMTLMAGMAALAVLILAPMLFVTTYWQFIGLRVLLAALAGAGPTLAYAAVAASCSPERRGQMVSLTSSAATLGWAASPLIAGALIQISPALLVLMNMGIFGIVALLLIGGQRGLFDPLGTLVEGRGMPSFPRAGLAALRPSLAGPRGLLDRLHAPATLMPARKVQQPRFTTAEVEAALLGRSHGSRAQSALDMAAQTARWMPTEPRKAFREVGRYADRVPAILYQMRNGGDPEMIGRELSPLGGSWPVRRTVEIAADLIARELNR